MSVVSAQSFLIICFQFYQILVHSFAEIFFFCFICCFWHIRIPFWIDVICTLLIHFDKIWNRWSQTSLERILDRICLRLFYCQKFTFMAFCCWWSQLFSASPSFSPKSHYHALCLRQDLLWGRLQCILFQQYAVFCHHLSNFRNPFSFIQFHQSRF